MAKLTVDPSLPISSTNFHTITNAEIAANPFDEIRVYPDVFPYGENVTVTTPNIRIIASSPGAVFLDGVLAMPPGGIGFQINSPNTVIDGFVIVNFDEGIQINSYNNKVINNIIMGTTSYGVGVFGDNNIIDKNQIHSTDNHVVYIYGRTNNSIKNNIIYVINPNFSGIFLNSKTIHNSVIKNQIHLTPGTMGIRADESNDDDIRKNIITSP